MSDDRQITDVLGVAPVGRAVERVTDSVMAGLEAVLGRVCLPAAEELGLHLRDKVGQWRSANLQATLAKAAPQLEAAANDGRSAAPRLVVRALESASWADTADVQELWAGLLASSCSHEEGDESNWIFICILEQLTSLQVSILKHACEASAKVSMTNGLFRARSLLKTLDDLGELTRYRDVYRLDRELDHLRELGLIETGFQGFSHELVAEIQPTALALYLYVRAQGSLATPVEYFKIGSE